jgi:hypothetical protein
MERGKLLLSWHTQKLLETSFHQWLLSDGRNIVQAVHTVFQILCLITMTFSAWIQKNALRYWLRHFQAHTAAEVYPLL